MLKTGVLMPKIGAEIAKTGADMLTTGAEIINCEDGANVPKTGADVTAKSSHCNWTPSGMSRAGKSGVTFADKNSGKSMFSREDCQRGLLEEVDARSSSSARCRVQNS